MEKERFEFVCMDTEAGNDAFVRHPSTDEEGLVVGWEGEHLIVETPSGEKRDWDFHECEEISRSKEEWPWR